jgi:hypothetical protein
VSGWKDTPGAPPVPQNYYDHATTTEYNGGRGRSSRYRGRCQLCGWRGETRQLLSRAFDDARQHRQKENAT